MVLSSSAMTDLGQPLPEFTVWDVMDSMPIAPADVMADSGLVVAFISAECPYVLHVLDVLTGLAAEYSSRGIGWLGIASNDPAICPEDNPMALKQFVLDRALGFRVGIDPDQQVARMFNAVCTPDFFLFDGSGELAYRGRMDATRPWSDCDATGDDLRQALHALASGNRPSVEQHPAVGCSIKWRES